MGHSLVKQTLYIYIYWRYILLSKEYMHTKFMSNGLSPFTDFLFLFFLVSFFSILFFMFSLSYMSTCKYGEHDDDAYHCVYIQFSM